MSESSKQPTLEDSSKTQGIVCSPADLEENRTKRRKLSHAESSQDVVKTLETKGETKTKGINPSSDNSRDKTEMGTSTTKTKNNNNKSTKKPKTKHLNPELLKLRRTIQLSCASNDFHTAIEAYQTMHIKQNVRMEPQSFYNLLNLCAGGLGERGIHIGTPKPDKTNNNNSEEKSDCENRIKKENNQVEYSFQKRKEYAYQIKNEMDSLELPLNETAYTALIRLLCQRENNDLKEAERILQQAENTQQCKPKLRMYGCLIEAFCNELNNNLGGALRVWKQMNNLKRKDKNGNLQSPIVPTEREYCILMKCAIRLGDYGVMERILSEIAEDILVPSINTKDTIIEWFQSEHAIDCEERDVDRKSALDSFVALPESSAPSMGPVVYQYKSAEQEQNTDTKQKERKWVVTSGDTIDTSSGVLQTGCLKGCALKPVQLNKESWKKMLEMNDDIVVKGEVAEHGKIPSAFAGGGKGKKRVLTKDAMDLRIQQWQSFKSFLHERIGPASCYDITAEKNEQKNKFDVVIDGANVGYYQRNFANAPKYVDYKQIDWVVQHFLERGKKVLLFMHERHFSHNLMPRWAESIMKRWDDACVLYKTPYGANDDWFWMHAALWGGRETMVLSNDLMRDHHFQMLAHRSFLRWKERHQVYFDFGEWIGSKREVILTYPDQYSRRIQRIDDGLVIPLPKKGDTNRFLDGQHEADDSASSNETYISIATPKM